MRIKYYYIDKSFLSLTAFQVLGSCVLGLGVLGPRVLFLHFRLCYEICSFWIIFSSIEDVQLVLVSSNKTNVVFTISRQRPQSTGRRSKSDNYKKTIE